jgi:2,3-dihydroxy-p-cumate/2,3-dihydroxybenzoate 3,4-dioxygenase
MTASTQLRDAIAARPFRCGALARVDLGVVDPERSRAFYRDVVGLQEIDPPHGVDAAFRCDDRPCSVLLRRSAVPGLACVAWAVEAPDALEVLRARGRESSLAVRQVDAATCVALGVRDALRVVDPASGATHEFHVPAPAKACDAFTPSHTRILRLGHIVVATDRHDGSVAFLSEAIDFRVSDRIAGGTTFMRPGASPWHHGIGVGRADGPRLHHVNFMVASIDDIGRAFHRLQRHRVPIVWGPGRHPPSGSVFLYFLDPDGLTVEYSFGMEAFDAHAPRPAQDLPAGPASVDAWAAPRDPLTGAVGAIL